LYFSSKYLVALVDLTVRDKILQDLELNIFSNICESSFVDGEMRNLLRSVKLDKNTTSVNINPYYIPVLKSEIQTIEFYIKNRDQKDLSVLSQPLTLCIHFKEEE
jgi:cytoskeletal protein RodZ